MLQASNSLLTRYPFFFTASLFARALPRDCVRAKSRLLTPFLINQEEPTEPFPVLLGLPRPPRNVFCPRLGEGRIRSLQTLFLGWTLAVLSLLPLQQAIAREVLTITLKEQAAVTAPTVFLGDVADLRGSDQARLAQLTKLPVAPSPSIGFLINLNRSQIQEQIIAALGNTADINIAGAAYVQVRLQGRALLPGDLLPLLKTHLLETTPWKESEIDIRSIGNLNNLELPPGEVALRIPQKAALSGSSSALIPVEVIFEGKPYRTLWISVDLRVRASVLQAARRIPYGKTIAREDVKAAVVEIADARLAYLRQTEDAIGKVARQTLSPGDPLTRESLTNPFLVRSGDTVHLRLERNGIQLATLARAEQDGRLGQTIRIRNLDFARSLKAQVVGRGEVKIQ
jgi:flagella basal body P-ring formation protein FlgA